MLIVWLVVAILIAGVVVIEGVLLHHVERLQKFLHGPAKGPLVLHRLREHVELAPGAIFDDRAPEFDDLFRSAGRSKPRQTFAHHQGDSVFKRRVILVIDAAEITALVFILQHCGKIAGDAKHPLRANRLNARLLDRFKDCARLLAFWSEAVMDGRVMASEPQRHRIGMAAHDRSLGGCGFARGFRQPRLGGVAGSNQGRFVGCKRDFHFGRAGHGAQATRDGALDWFGGGGLGLAGLAIGRGRSAHAGNISASASKSRAAISTGPEGRASPRPGPFSSGLAIWMVLRPRAAAA